MTWVSVLLVILLVGGAYLGSVWLPLWFDHYTVKQVVADYMNQSAKNHDDEQLRRDMVARSAPSSPWRASSSGRKVKVPAIPLDEGGVPGSGQRDPHPARRLRVRAPGRLPAHRPRSLHGIHPGPDGGHQHPGLGTRTLREAR